MEPNALSFQRLGPGDLEPIRALFVSVFAGEPWHDDWSDARQLELYLRELVEPCNALTYGLLENGELVGVSMGRIKHWYTGTEYCIDELCIRTDRQGKGLGTFFLREIERAITALGLTQIYLQTDREFPAYAFYRKNGFYELETLASLGRQVTEQSS